MSEKKENKPKLKNKHSYLPQGWRRIPLWQACESPVSGYSPIGTNRPANDGEMGVLKLSCIQGNRFSPEKNKAVEGVRTNDLKTPVRKNTLIMSRSNTEELVGAVCYVDNDFPNLFLSDLLWRVSAKDKHKIDLKWLSYLLSFTPYRAKIIARANGTSQTMKKINRAGFLGIRILCPKVDEQKKIAKILSTWDIAIDQTRELISAKKQRKKAFTQKMLDGKRTRKGIICEKLTALPLGAMLSPVSRPVPKPNRPYIAIGIRSHGKGTFHRAVEEPAKVSMDTLYRIEQDDIILNITFAWEGAIAIADDIDHGGLVSHRFPTYRVEKNTDLAFFRQLMHTKRFVWNLGLISPGGAGRNRVLSKSDFLKLKVLVPSKNTQMKIGRILSSIDQEIKFYEEKLITLEKQKRGLMQKLLTGEVRVNT